MYNIGMTPKQRRFIEEYLKDLNATQAAIRAGYAESSAYQRGHELVRNSEDKAEIERIMSEQRMKPEDIVTLYERMVMGEIPTKTVEYPSKVYGKPVFRHEYDVKGALQDLGKVYALFVDKQIVENIEGLEIVDDCDTDVSKS